MSEHILVVDDDPGIQELLETTLQDEGYQVVVARDGLDAMEKVRNSSPALILLDLMMPRMNGYEFADAMRREHPLTAIPIIVITADAQAAEKAAQIGAHGWLEKPFDYEKLMAYVSHYTRPEA